MLPSAAIGPAPPTALRFSPSKCSWTTFAFTPSSSRRRTPEFLALKSSVLDLFFPLRALRLLRLNSTHRSLQKEGMAHGLNIQSRPRASPPLSGHRRVPWRQSPARLPRPLRQLPHRQQDPHAPANPRAHGRFVRLVANHRPKPAGLA